MAQEPEEKWVMARVLRGQILSGDSNVHVPLGTEWEGRGGIRQEAKKRNPYIQVSNRWR